MCEAWKLTSSDATYIGLVISSGFSSLIITLFVLNAGNHQVQSNEPYTPNPLLSALNEQAIFVKEKIDENPFWLLSQPLFLICLAIAMLPFRCHIYEFACWINDHRRKSIPMSTQSSESITRDGI